MNNASFLVWKENINYTTCNQTTVMSFLSLDWELRVHLISIFFTVSCCVFEVIAGLPVADAVVMSVFGRLCRKMNTRGREETRSGTEKRCFHKLFFRL